MSMLPALDESEKNLSHGWSTSTIYDMDSIATNQEGSQNIYQHLINQNNSGNVPDAVVEEEIIPQNGQMQTCQTGSPMSNQRFPAGQMNVNVIQSQQHQVVNHPPMQQQTSVQFEPQRSQHSLISPQVSVGAGTKKITYVIPQGQGMPKSTNPSGTVIHGQQKVQNFVPTVPTNTRQQEDMIDQALKLQQRKIAENKEILEAYKKMGFQSAGNNVQSPQVPLSLSSVTLPNFTVKTMNQNVMNNSAPAQNSIDVKMVQSGGATNQAKSVLQLNPTGLVNRPRAVSKPGTFVQQGFRPQIIHNNKYRPSGNIRPQHNNPVQVSMVSSNQVHTNTNPYPGNSSQLNPGNINKKNVILEGGGEFEEGQAYVIRDKDGKSTTRVWRNGDFVPLENSSIIQHREVDSSQRGRGSRGGRGGRGRGRGQGQMNNTGVRTPSPRATPRPTRFPTPRVTQPNFNVRGPNNVIRHDTPQMNHVRPRHPSMPSGMPSGIPSPQTIIIQTPSPQLSLSPHNASQTPPSRTDGQQTPIMPKLDIKNLMPPSLPPAQGSQKTAQPSGTNLARDQISQEEKEEPDKDLTQYLSTSLPPDSQGGKQEVLDPPRIPTDPNAVAVCQFCGYISEDKIKCESCNRKFTSATRYQVKGTGALISEDSGPKKRKAEPSEKTIGVSVNKKAFYGGKKLQDQEKLYHQILQSANGNVTVSFQNPRIIVRGSRTRGRGRGRGRGMVIPETITLSSDEEENGESGHRGSGDVITASQTKSTSSGDPSVSQQGPPESPLIPEIPISSAKGDSRSRRDKMEDATGKASKDREGSASPVNVLLNARSITVGTFKGIPIEPIVLCKNGLRFFMEGQHGSHRFTILPGEIQQCLAHFSERSLSYLFFLVSKSCGMRTRRDLGIKYHKDPKMPPPEPYFDPFGSDLTHQMITVIMEKIELTVRVEFQKYMDLFKSWGKSGDEAFFMELTEQEADEVRKQSLSSAVQPASAYTSQGMSSGDHQYTQHGDEDRRSRSPSPPRMGFVGYSIIKLLTYPPPPEKGGIPITNEDLFCLQEGEFLNDVIIDFYLKYLHNEILSEKDRERTHIFSSFFYKRLTQRIRGAAIDDDPNLALPEKRHARVKTWTRHVDLFKKDFIVIPINEHAHWFLAIVCYPWLMEPVKNRYIPNRCSTPMLENLNIPTPPQPTDDNTDEMDGEEQENPNPSTDKPEEQSQVPETPTVSDNTTTTTESQSTESEQSTQPSQEVNGEKQADNTTTDNATIENSESENKSENKSENMEAEQNEQREDPLQTDSEKTDSGPTDGEGEPMDTSEKSDETSQTTTQGSDECTDSQEKPDENQRGSDECREDGEKNKEECGEKKEEEGEEEAGQETSQEEASQETAQSETQTQTRTATPKPAQSQKLPNIRPIRGQTVEEGDSSTQDDVMTGIKQPCVLIFDSLSGPSRSRIVTVLKEYLQVEWQVKKATEAGRALNKAVIRGCVPKVPQQNNYSDCGVFMLQYVESFFEDPIQDFATPMKGLHDWFSLQKIEGKREELKDLIISLKEKYESTED